MCWSIQEIRRIAIRLARRRIHALRSELPIILASREDVVSLCMRHMIESLAADWHRLDDRIKNLSDGIVALVKRDAACERAMTVPGIGPIISSAIVSAIGNGAAFSKGRDFAAWIGLVPKQISTGDRTILGKVSKRGNRYLRKLFMQAAWVLLVQPASWQRNGLAAWIEAAKKRLHRNVLAIALANKLARIEAWWLIRRQRADIHDGSEPERSTKKPDTLMRDSNLLNHKIQLATHGRTIHEPPAFSR